MRCPACQADNPELARFCASCGGRLTATCPHCSAEVALGARFCTACGSTMPAAEPVSTSGERAALGAERRRVSVLFADLENFTGLAEAPRPGGGARRPVALLRGRARTVAVYGGVIEKFIGDAVVAVWGAPVTHEDDAERAVRAALELLAAVAQFSGSATGERLVARAASRPARRRSGWREGQGLVSGDVINTAARLQAVAARATVVVDERTRHAIGEPRSPSCRPARAPEGQGHADRRVRALRSATGRGAVVAPACRPPFVGRDAELRELIGLFDATAAEGRGRMASVLWHRRHRQEPPRLGAGAGRARRARAGRVADRRRAGIRQRHRVRRSARSSAAGAASPSTRRRRSHGGSWRRRSAELFRDPEDRAWVEPRLAVLLDPDAAESYEREELFAAWRRFFERLADDAPTVLVFEDLQWADAGLLDFIEHLGTWTREHPILVLTLARPELLDARPTWGAAQRSFTALRLDRLPDPAMRELLAGRARGIPAAALRHILQRAGGVPLYAVELTRMLIDRGQLVPIEGAYRLAGPLADADVPDSLQGLLAARIDALPTPERSVLRAAAMLGRRFSPEALAAVTGIGTAELQRRSRRSSTARCSPTTTSSARR